MLYELWLNTMVYLACCRVVDVNCSTGEVQASSIHNGSGLREHSDREEVISFVPFIPECCLSLYRDDWIKHTPKSHNLILTYLSPNLMGKQIVPTYVIGLWGSGPFLLPCALVQPTPSHPHNTYSASLCDRMRTAYESVICVFFPNPNQN